MFDAASPEQWSRIMFGFGTMLQSIYVAGIQSGGSDKEVQDPIFDLFFQMFTAVVVKSNSKDLRNVTSLLFESGTSKGNLQSGGGEEFDFAEFLQFKTQKGGMPLKPKVKMNPQAAAAAARAAVNVAAANVAAVNVAAANVAATNVARANAGRANVAFSPFAAAGAGPAAAGAGAAAAGELLNLSAIFGELTSSPSGASPVGTVDETKVEGARQIILRGGFRGELLADLNQAEIVRLVTSINPVELGRQIQTTTNAHYTALTVPGSEYSLENMSIKLTNLENQVMTDQRILQNNIDMLSSVKRNTNIKIIDNLAKQGLSESGQQFVRTILSQLHESEKTSSLKKFFNKTEKENTALMNRLKWKYQKTALIAVSLASLFFTLTRAYDYAAAPGVAPAPAPDVPVVAAVTNEAENVPAALVGPLNNATLLTFQTFTRITPGDTDPVEQATFGAVLSSFLSPIEYIGSAVAAVPGRIGEAVIAAPGVAAAATAQAAVGVAEGTMRGLATGADAATGGSLSFLIGAARTGIGNAWNYFSEREKPIVGGVLSILGTKVLEYTLLGDILAYNKARTELSEAQKSILESMSLLRKILIERYLAEYVEKKNGFMNLQRLTLYNLIGNPNTVTSIIAEGGFDNFTRRHFDTDYTAKLRQKAVGQFLGIIDYKDYEILVKQMEEEIKDANGEIKKALEQYRNNYRKRQANLYAAKEAALDAARAVRDGASNAANLTASAAVGAAAFGAKSLLAVGAGAAAAAAGAPELAGSMISGAAGLLFKSPAAPPAPAPAPLPVPAPAPVPVPVPVPVPAPAPLNLRRVVAAPGAAPAAIPANLAPLVNVKALVDPALTLRTYFVSNKANLYAALASAASNGLPLDLNLLDRNQQQFLVVYRGFMDNLKHLSPENVKKLKQIVQTGKVPQQLTNNTTGGKRKRTMKKHKARVFKRKGTKRRQH